MEQLDDTAILDDVAKELFIFRFILFFLDFGRMLNRKEKKIALNSHLGLNFWEMFEPQII